MSHGFRNATAVCALVVTASATWAQTGAGYELSRSTIDGGGLMFATGNDYEASGTIGQPDAGTISGGSYTVTGGFWVRVPKKPTPPNPPNDRRKNRYISFAPNNSGQPVRLVVTLTASLAHPGSVGMSWWVQTPVTPGNPLLGPGECVARLGPEATAAEIDWDAAGCQTLHVTGCPIEPTSVYDIQAVIGTTKSVALSVATILKPGVKHWCDTVGFFDGNEWTPPNGTTNIDDAVAGIKTFQGGPVVPPGPVPPGNVAHLSVADVDPGDINLVTNINDVFNVILAFQGDRYPFGPADAAGNCP